MIKKDVPWNEVYSEGTDRELWVSEQGNKIIDYRKYNNPDEADDEAPDCPFIVYNLDENKLEGFSKEQLEDMLKKDPQKFIERFSRTRSIKEMQDYLNEAIDKVWLMRSGCFQIDDIETEKKVDEAIKRIFNTYNDIPEEGYDNWECGFWNGVLGTLNWVLDGGLNTKTLLDT